MEKKECSHPKVVLGKRESDDGVKMMRRRCLEISGRRLFSKHHAAYGGRTLIYLSPSVLRDGL